MSNPFYEQYGLKTQSSADTPPSVKYKSPLPPVSSKQYSKEYQEWARDAYGAKFTKDEFSYQDYNELKKDPQIRVARRLIFNYLLSKKHIITPASQSEEDIELKEFIEAVLNDMEIPMKEIRKHFYTALDYGYSVAEIIYKINNQDQTTISRIKPMQIETLQKCFVPDEYGNLITIIQNYVGVGGQSIQIPAEKCMTYAFEAEAGNYYGNSILKPIHNDVKLKEHVNIWLGIFLEKHGSPFLLGKHASDTNKDTMLNSLDDVRDGATAVVIRDDEEVSILESNKEGKAFFDTLTYVDVLILRTFLIGSLVLGQADASGSYAQSQTHMDALQLFLEGIHEDIASEFQKLINKIIDLNFVTDNYPTFSFELFDRKDLLGLLNAIFPYAKFDLLEPETQNGLNQLINQVLDQFADIKVQEDDNIMNDVDLLPIKKDEEVVNNSESTESGVSTGLASAKIKPENYTGPDPLANLKEIVSGSNEG